MVPEGSAALENARRSIMNIPTTALPIVQRELLVSSRKRLTFWSRMIAAGFGFVAVFFVLGLDPNPTAAAALGSSLFHSLSMVAFWTCLFGGALLTADCLSVEKREGTLGLIFLTDLKGYDVVFGKLVAKSLVAVFCVFAIVPMLALPLLIGGVTGGDFCRVILFLLNTLFVSLSIGMAVSVFSREPRNALAVATFMIILWILIPAGIGALLPVPLRTCVHLLSPLMPFGHAFTAVPGRNFGLFTASILLHHAVGWLCLRIASRHAQSCWHEQPKKKNTSRESRPLNDQGRLALRRALLSVNAVLWLESRDPRLRKVVFGLFLLFVGGCWLLNCHRAFHWRNLEYAVGTVIFLHLFLKLLVAFSASTRLIEAIRDGALSMVLSTRMTVIDIVHGEFLAAKRLFGWPLIVLLLFDLFWLTNIIRHERSPAHIYGAAALVLGWTLVLLANCAALVWRSLYHSLRAKRPYRAAVRSFLEIVVAPFIWFGFILSGVEKPSNLVEPVVVFTLINLVNTVLFARSAYLGLQKELPAILTDVPLPVRPLDEFDEDYALLK
jgi:ABC-type transport system involved in multi-copper enzyme maturation permease subunit